MTYRTRNMPKRKPSPPPLSPWGKSRSGPVPKGSVEVEMIEKTPLPGQDKIRTARSGGIMSSKMMDRMGRAMPMRGDMSDKMGRAMARGMKSGGGVKKMAAGGMIPKAGKKSLVVPNFLMASTLGMQN